MPKHFRFKVQLREVRPTIWRRFLLRTSASFADLHEAIQDCGGWEDAHLYSFLEPGGAGYDELPGAGTGEGETDWASTALASWFGEEQRQCVYWYDFGDDWMHDVGLERIEEHDEAFERRLLDGARAFPLEDCGGIPGYERCVEALRRGREPTGGEAGPEFDREELDELLDWIGDWDPERFDLETTRRSFDRETAPSARRVKHRAMGEAYIEPPGTLCAAPLPDAPTTRPVGMVWHLFRIAQAGSTHPPGESVTTGLACIRRPGRRKCPGRIVVQRRVSDDEIEWRCSDCSDGGSISGWRGGRDDLSEAADSHRRSGAEETVVRVPFDLYGALMHERNIAIEPSRLLCSARASAGQVELRGSLDEIDELLDETCAEANHLEPGKQQKRLDAAGELLREVLQADQIAGDEPEAEAVIAEATRGLRLTGEELEGLRQLYRSAGVLLARLGLETQDRIAGLLRETGESLVLCRKVREVLAVRDVRYRELRHFLGRISGLLERIQEFGQRCPSGGLEVCRALLRGIGDIANRVATDENELEVENRFIAEAALEMAGRIDRTSEGLRPLLEDLLDLWRKDDCCAFHFVPELIVGLELGKREKNWLRKQIDERLGDGKGTADDLLEELAGRLR